MSTNRLLSQQVYLLTTFSLPPLSNLSVSLSVPISLSVCLSLSLCHSSVLFAAPKPKKVITSAKKKSTLGAKKLSVPSSADSSASAAFKLETFESMEKKQQRAAAEQEDHELARKLQKDELAKGGSLSGGGVSRISSLLQEEEKSVSQSPYQAAPSIPSASPYASLYSSPTTTSSSYSSSARASSHVSAPAPPAADMNKFSKSKGISSDQYFGRDEIEAEEARRNLAKYSNSTSISSDMLSGQDGRYGGSSTREADNLSGSGLDFDRLKDSVKGFFDEFR
jgi:hypothetical protein